MPRARAKSQPTKNVRRSARLAQPTSAQPRRTSKKVLVKKPATTSPRNPTPADLEEKKILLKALTNTLEVKIKKKSVLQVARYKQQNLQDDHEIAVSVAQLYVAGINYGMEDQESELVRATGRLKACRERLGKAHQAILCAEGEVAALLIKHQRLAEEIERMEEDESDHDEALGQ
ncbi:hypothetical protein FHETE_993 [Fusarium heterosporum]|uniref:Uncharacterized protein n=1 Tax=Fusarium heterosporum TaxID=42747 RepID=A0A8H5U3Q1_FUSHE|nr:hypothetical protein FHETE_993 [Fusarium heterosporum]